MQHTRGRNFGEHVFFLALLVSCAMLPVSEQSQCYNYAEMGQSTARCTGQNWTSVPTHLESDIKKLFFSNNKLTRLDLDAFKSYRQLQELYLAGNRISYIVAGAFRGLENLRFLGLAGNALDSIPVEAFDQIRQLTELNLGNNKITYITANAFHSLANLEKLHLDNNVIGRIEPKAFAGLNVLGELNIMNNKITSLSPKMERHLSTKLTIVRMSGNPWICDCKLRWLRVFLDKYNINWNFGNDFREPACAAPPVLNNIKMKPMTPNQFACPASVVVGNSTSIELEVGGNMTIPCDARGDPLPTIAWFKGKKQLPSISKNRRQYYYNEPNGETNLVSTLWIHNVVKTDAGDYRCAVQNQGGTAEVTFKVWIKGETIVKLDNNKVEPPAMSQEVIIGVAAGSLLVLVVVATAVCCYCKKLDRRRHEYRVRDYKNKPKKEKRNNDIPAEQRYDKNTPNATTELLPDRNKDREWVKDAETNSNSILRQNGNGQSKSLEKQKLLQEPDKQKLLQETGKEKNGRELPKPAVQQNDVKTSKSKIPPFPPLPAKPLDEETHEFKMKIFVHSKDKVGSLDEEDGVKDTQPLCPSTAREKPQVGNCVRGSTPDLLQNSHTKHSPVHANHVPHTGTGRKSQPASKKSCSADNLASALRESDSSESAPPSSSSRRSCDKPLAAVDCADLKSKSPGASRSNTPSSVCSSQLSGSHSLHCDISKANKLPHHDIGTGGVTYKTLPNPKSGARSLPQHPTHPSSSAGCGSSQTQPRKHSNKPPGSRNQVRFQTLPPKPRYTPAAVVGLEDVYPPKNKPAVAVHNLYGSRYAPAHYNTNPAISGSMDRNFAPARKANRTSDLIPISRDSRKAPQSPEVEVMPEIGHTDEFGTVV